MILAELEVFHSRFMAPTRRLALGTSQLPCDPAPGFGGLLLGGVVARFIPDIDPDLHGDLFSLTREIESGARVAQPRLRHRLQKDRVGLDTSRHRLCRLPESGVTFQFDVEQGSPAQHILGAIYAARDLRQPNRALVLETLRRGLRWQGPVGPSLVAYLSGSSAGMLALGSETDPIRWALDKLGLDESYKNGEEPPGKSVVVRQFRRMLRDAHPDLGAVSEDAAQRIAELSEARRILLT